MKRMLAALFLIVSFSAANAQSSRADSILKDLRRHPEYVLVAAHRAAHADFPENSLASIEEAIRLQVDIAELDVQRTKDGIFVLMHDRTITRTTGQQGSVADYTLAQLQQFPLLHNGQPTRHRIPTFKDALLAAKGRILVDVDFKVDGIDAAKDAYLLIQQTGMMPYVLFFLYDHPDAKTLLAHNAFIPILPRVRNAAATRETLGYGLFPALHLDETFYSKEIAEEVRATGARVWMNALGAFDKEEKEKPGTGFDRFFASFPLTGIVQTDLPGELVAYLQKKGKHR